MAAEGDPPHGRKPSNEWRPSDGNTQLPRCARLNPDRTDGPDGQIDIAALNTSVDNFTFIGRQAEVVVTVASTSAVRCTGTALRAAVVRIAVTGGLTLLACVFGSAVANAATSADPPSPGVIANTLQTDVSDLVNGVLNSLGGHHHHHVDLAGGGTSALQPPADDGNGNGGGHDNGNGGNGAVNPGGPQQSAPGGSGDSAGQGSSGDDVWTGTTTVTVPTKPTPPAPPAPPPAPQHVQPAPPPVTHTVAPQVQTRTEPSMGSPSGVVPDLPHNPIDLPLQQPASQPISSPSTGGTAGHDLGNANGIADVTPPGSGFRPSPGSTTEEHSAKRVSDGVPGLPSTSPD